MMTGPLAAARLAWAIAWRCPDGSLTFCAIVVVAQGIVEVSSEGTPKPVADAERRCSHALYACGRQPCRWLYLAESANGIQNQFVTEDSPRRAAHQPRRCPGECAR